jgi:nitrite reductase/ring-hydroxylating ferredoxin subunit
MTVPADGWHPLGNVDDIEVGDKREVTLPNGKWVLLIKTQGGLRACCVDCPHQATPLAEGSIEGNILTCPLHFWQWNIDTGEQIDPAELPLKIFELRQENDQWFIRA